MEQSRLADAVCSGGHGPTTSHWEIRDVAKPSARVFERSLLFGISVPRTHEAGAMLNRRRENQLKPRQASRPRTYASKEKRLKMQKRPRMVRPVDSAVGWMVYTIATMSMQSDPTEYDTSSRVRTAEVACSKETKDTAEGAANTFGDNGGLEGSGVHEAADLVEVRGIACKKGVLRAIQVSLIGRSRQMVLTPVQVCKVMQASDSKVRRRSGSRKRSSHPTPSDIAFSCSIDFWILSNSRSM